MGRAVACGRLLPDGHIGRWPFVRNAGARRRSGNARAAHRTRERARGCEVMLNAQTHAMPFYARYGFTGRRAVRRGRHPPPGDGGSPARAYRMNLARLLTRSAALHPNRPAIALGARIVHDYREFARRSSTLAASLAGPLALRPGDRVAIFATNDPRYLEILYGAWIAAWPSYRSTAAASEGVCVHPRGQRRGHPVHERGCRGAAATALAGHRGPATRDLHRQPRLRRLVEDGSIAPRRSPGRPRLAVHTSGTTGQAEGRDAERIAISLR